MANRDTTALESYFKKLDSLGKLGRGAAKKLADPDQDPFEAKAALAAVAKAAEAIGMSRQGLDEALAHLDRQCIQTRAEFWDRFADESSRRRWSVVGTTARRLIQGGVLLEALDEDVKVLESGLSLSHHAPTVARAIEAEVQDCEKWNKDPQRFVDLLLQAYDSLPGEGEKSLEQVFKAFVWVAQKPGFWRTLQPGAYSRCSRASFRAGLAGVMSAGSRAKDQRAPRLGTALSGEYWEVFSPGEGRVVQVGRLSFES